ncbi:MAG: hypothetical protein MJB14_23280 [Spirochaetes bacterium]|nr:hypothetical protein [Spirochaetota bacterium]
MIKKIIILTIILLLVTSCYQQTLFFNKDLSGKINYKVTITKEYTQFISVLNQDDTSINLNLKPILDSETLAEVVQKSNDVEILNEQHSEDQGGIINEIQLSFKNYNDLAQALPNSYFRNSLFREKNIITVSTILSLDFLGDSTKIRQLYQNMDNNSRKYIDYYADKVKLFFVYHSYKTITQPPKTGNFQLSEDKKILTIEISLLDILQSSGDLKLQFALRR